MRVTLVTTSFPISKNSSSGIFIYHLAKQLSRHCDLTVLLPCHTKPISRNEKSMTIRCFRYAPQNLQYLAHKPGGIPAALKTKTNYLILPFFLFGLYIKCFKLTRQTDIFHANWAIAGVVVALAGRISRKPVITTLRGSDVNRAKNSKINRFILYLSLKFSDYVVAVSDSIYSTVTEQFPKYKSKISVIPNGVGDEFLNVSRIQQKDDSTVQLVCIGNLLKDKNYVTVINALALVVAKGKFNLTIVGDGPERSNLENIAQSNGVYKYTNFVGQVSQTKIVELLANSDIFIHPSLSEGRSNALLEAMGSGIAIIGSDIESNSDLIIHNQNGLLFSPLNCNQLSKHILKLGSDSIFRYELGQNAKYFIINSRFNWNNAALSYVKLYKNIVYSSNES